MYYEGSDTDTILSVTASARHASMQGVKTEGGGGFSCGRTHLKNDHDLQAAIGSDNGDSATAQGHQTTRLKACRYQ